MNGWVRGAAPWSHSSGKGGWSPRGLAQEAPLCLDSHVSLGFLRLFPPEDSSWEERYWVAKATDFSLPEQTFPQKPQGMLLVWWARPLLPHSQRPLSLQWAPASQSLCGLSPGPCSRLRSASPRPVQPWSWPPRERVPRPVRPLPSTPPLTALFCPLGRPERGSPRLPSPCPGASSFITVPHHRHRGPHPPSLSPPQAQGPGASQQAFGEAAKGRGLG